MARVFRHTYSRTLRNGRKVTRELRKWYVEYHDGDRWRKVPGYTDRKATAQLGAELERRAAQRQAGLIDRFSEHRKRPLAEHLTDRHAALTAKDNTAAHADKQLARTERILQGCRFSYWPDLAANRVQTFLAELRGEGLSMATSNYYLQAVKSFARWMVRDGRAPDSPLDYLQGGNANTDRRHDRRALDADALRRLLRTAASSPNYRRMSGSDRAVLYQLAAETGLRASELRSLTRASLVLEADPPTVTVKAAYSKHRRDDTLPLKPETAQLLARWVGDSELTSKARLFATLPGKPAEMLRTDLRRARARWIRETGDCAERRRRRKSDFLEYRNDAGEFADFHALRHTFISNLARGGVHPKLAQSLARHSTITLTMDRYSHTVIGEQADALSALPDLATSPVPERQLATGTYAVDKPSPGKSMAASMAKQGAFALPRRASVCTLEASTRAARGSQKSLENKANSQRGAPPCTAIPASRREGLEPPTAGLEIPCSIQLSYRRRRPADSTPADVPMHASVRRAERGARQTHLRAHGRRKSLPQRDSCRNSV